MTDNYQLSRDRAQDFFLRYDQSSIVSAWNLLHDEQYLYLDFLGEPYRVCRKTGVILRSDGREAGFEETLSIFDLLCHHSPEKSRAGGFAPVNSLKGRPVVGVSTDFHSEIANRFDLHQDAFQTACLALGGKPLSLGDLGFSFPLFEELTVGLKFYGSDEDFPASIVLLWDENMLQYVYYETVFYIAGFLLHQILEQMERLLTKEDSQ